MNMNDPHIQKLFELMRAKRLEIDLDSIPDDPNDITADGLIELVEEHEDTEEAIEVLEKALKVSVTNDKKGRALLQLGLRHEDLGNDEKAIEFHTRCLELVGNEAQLLFSRGRAHFRLGHYAEAKNDLELSLALGLDKYLEDHGFEPDNRYEAQRILAAIAEPGNEKQSNDSGSDLHSQLPPLLRRSVARRMK